MHAWVGYTASAQVLSDVARESLGCDITQTTLDEAGVTYDAMEAGSVDVIIEDWGGGRWAEWVDRGAIVEVGLNGNVGLIGMYVPQWMCDEYPDITDGTKLNEYVDLFKTPESGDKGAWLEGPPGYTTIGEKLIEANGLNYKIINTGSEPLSSRPSPRATTTRKPCSATSTSRRTSWPRSRCAASTSRPTTGPMRRRPVVSRTTRRPRWSSSPP
jgi:glycine betaine/proline transport system substrate-binding protein